MFSQMTLNGLPRHICNGLALLSCLGYPFLDEPHWFRSLLLKLLQTSHVSANVGCKEPRKYRANRFVGPLVVTSVQVQKPKDIQLGSVWSYT